MKCFQLLFRYHFRSLGAHSIRLPDTFLFLCFPGVGLRRLGRGLLADMAFSVRDVDIGVDGSEMCNFRYWGEGLDFGGGASDLSEMSRLE